jgi:hypothetical protein
VLANFALVKLYHVNRFVLCHCGLTFFILASYEGFRLILFVNCIGLNPILQRASALVSRYSRAALNMSFAIDDAKVL